MRRACGFAVALVIFAVGCGAPPTPSTAKDLLMRGVGLRTSSPPLKPEEIPAGAAAAPTPAPPVAPRPVRRVPRPAPAPAPEPVAVAPPPVEVTPPVRPAPVYYAPPVIVDHSIYTAADLNVAGPSLEPSQLPWQWPKDVRRTDTLEVLISPEGDVERIRLLSVPRRMTDVMTLSAAKAWKFAPATKEGTPVRYRLLLTPGGPAY